MRIWGRALVGTWTSRPPAVRRLPPAAALRRSRCARCSAWPPPSSPGVPPTPTNVTHESGGYVVLRGAPGVRRRCAWAHGRLGRLPAGPAAPRPVRRPDRPGPGDGVGGLPPLVPRIPHRRPLRRGRRSVDLARGPGPGNSTGHVPPIGKPVNGTPSNFTVVGQTFPGWVAYALVLGVGVAIALVAVPLAYVLAGRRRGELATRPSGTRRGRPRGDRGHARRTRVRPERRPEGAHRRTVRPAADRGGRATWWTPGRGRPARSNRWPSPGGASRPRRRVS